MRGKTALAASIAATLGGLVTISVSSPVSAALVTNDKLIIGAGSFFSMDTNGDGIVTPREKTPIAMNNGLIIGTIQDANGSHAGVPGTGTITENPGIDQPWDFFKNTGMHYTYSNVDATDVDASNQTLDLSGWGITWRNIPRIDMGGGIQDCGTTSDGICISGSTDAPIDIEGTFDNGTGIGHLACGVDCSNNDTFTLTYDAIVPQGDPSGFGGVPYRLNMVGTISSVPIPAAAWLFGSGLLGLAGIARRKAV